jgi:hypothetical protein
MSRRQTVEQIAESSYLEEPILGLEHFRVHLRRDVLREEGKLGIQKEAYFVAATCFS